MPPTQQRPAPHIERLGPYKSTVQAVGHSAYSKILTRVRTVSVAFVWNVRKLLRTDSLRDVWQCVRDAMLWTRLSSSSSLICGDGLVWIGVALHNLTVAGNGNAATFAIELVGKGARAGDLLRDCKGGRSMPMGDSEVVSIV